MYESDFSKLCPLHFFANLCSLEEREKKSLSLPEQIKAFLMYPFQDESIRIAEKIHALCSQYNVRVYDAQIEPGAAIIKSCKICRLALASNFGIALLSPLNYNVMFEIGYLFGLQKNVLFLIDTSLTQVNQIPFDLGDRILVTFNDIGTLESNFRREFPEFLKQVKQIIKSRSTRKHIYSHPKTFLYEYRSVEREDELHLDGSETVTIRLDMLAHADMPGFTENRYTVSKDLLPFSSFNIKILRFERNTEDDLKFEILEETHSKKRWKWVFDPPLRKGERLSLSYQVSLSGHRTMSTDDLLQVAKHRNKLDIVMARVWRNISVPTHKFSYKYTFPVGYDISHAQPLVQRDEKLVRREELRLNSERLFKQYKDSDGRWLLNLNINSPIIYYSYGFAWIPPSKDQYDSLCAKQNVFPLHCRPWDAEGA